MSVINEIKEFTTEIDKILNIAYEKRQKLIKWCYLNKERVKSIYPIKDTIYEIINPGKALDVFFKDSDVKFRFREKYYSLKNKYYFKVTDIDFDFDNEFHGWMGEETKMPFVKGVVLDSNHDRITPSYVFDDIEITHLKEINKEDLLKEKLLQLGINCTNFQELSEEVLAHVGGLSSLFSNGTFIGNDRCSY